MKEKMTLHDEDDHMGFASIPLSSIPVEGLDKWTRLKPISKLEVCIIGVALKFYYVNINKI